MKVGFAQKYKPVPSSLSFGQHGLGRTGWAGGVDVFGPLWGLFVSTVWDLG